MSSNVPLLSILIPSSDPAILESTLVEDHHEYEVLVRLTANVTLADSPGPKLRLNLTQLPILQSFNPGPTPGHQIS